MVGGYSYSVTSSQLKVTQGWRESAEAKHFVTSLEAHFKGRGSGSVGHADFWTIEFISIKFLSNILEAFNGDASGFVTIKEVNDFTKSRPLNWGCAFFQAYRVDLFIIVVDFLAG